MRFFSRHGALLALAAVAIGVRFAWIGAIPGPAGDEANWANWALALHRHQPVDMPTEASFVSLAFARLIAFAFEVAGPSFAVARSVNAVASLLAVIAIYAAFRSIGRPRAAIVSAAFLAVHPWCVAWSRTAAVPYAIALATSVVGASSFVVGIERRKPRLVALGIIVVAFGAHVSPLTIVSALACASLVIAPEHRYLLKQPSTYVALAIGAAIAVMPALGALHAASTVSAPERSISILGRVLRYSHMVGTGLAGEATLRHFGHAALPVPVASLTAIVPIAAIALSCRRDASTVGRLGLAWLGLGVVLVPLVLSQGRQWYLPDIDRERYLFALLPGLAFVVGEVSDASRTRGMRIAGAAVVALVAVATVRLSVDAFRGGGPDRGSDVFAGGEAYRGFRGSDVLRAPVESVADIILAELPEYSGIVLSEAALRPISFAVLRRLSPGRGGLPRYFFAESEYYPDPYTHSGSLAFVVYAERLFPVDGPTSAYGEHENRRLRERMYRDYADVRRIGVVRQPNGEPLIEVFRAERPPRPR